MTISRKPFVRPERQPVTPSRSIHRCSYSTGGEVVSVPKSAPLRSEAYRRYVASQDCFGCRLVGFSQAAHLNEGKGLSMKVSDALLFPLCAPHFGNIGCHSMFDLALDGLTREERRAQGVRWVEQMQARAVADGWRFNKAGIERV